MRLFFVLDEGIYHTSFLAEFVRLTDDLIVGAAIVTKVPNRNNVERYFLKHLNYFTLKEIIKTIWVKFNTRLSVKSVLKSFSIPFFKVENDINKEEYISKIKEFEPDIIVSSNPLIFGEEILKLPKSFFRNTQ